jgi:Kef-type K+ transport system membrane component KefB
MWRTLTPVLAVGLSIIFGLGLLYIFVEGTIGTATALAGSFALVAVAVTAYVLHDDSEADDGEATGRHMRL